MKKTIYLSAISIALILNACNQSKETDKKVGVEKKDNNENLRITAAENVNLKIDNVTFTKSLNKAESSVAIENGKIAFTAFEGTDYFNSVEGTTSSNSAPILLTKIDNSKPFTFTAKVSPEFTNDGTYTAGVLYLYSNDNLYQKVCFEQDERGQHRLVTVRTVETSDDNNHDVVNQSFVYMKISSDGNSVGSYYSLDNKNWQMVRLYKNSYPSELYLGISSQSPKQKKNTTMFEDVKIETTSIRDFRIGV